MEKNLKKLIIIPAYNEARNIQYVVEDIKKHAPDFDYVIIDDCSTDETKEVCLNKGYNVVNLSANLGIGGGVQTGYKYAQENNYDIAVQFDGDGQHDARYLHQMLDYLCERNLDMVIGSRFIDKEGFQSTKSRRMGINFLSSLIKLVTGKRVLDVTSGLRMVNRKGIDEFCKYYPKDYPEPETIASMLRRGAKVGEIAVQMRERKEGESSINLLKSVYYMMKVSLAIIIDLLKAKEEGGQKWEHDLDYSL